MPARKLRLVELGPVPVVYADAVARVEIEGGNVRMTQVVIRVIDGERVAVPVLEIIRPVDSYSVGRLQGMIDQARGDTVVAFPGKTADGIH